MALSGAAIAYATVGGLVLYSGVKGATLSDTAKAVLSGNLTVSDTESVDFSSSSSSGGTSGTSSGSGTGTVPPGDTGAASNSAAQNQALAKQIATSMGLSSWTTGQEWSDWVALWNQESGWSATAHNPGGASGIPQSLGHPGTPGSLGWHEFGYSGYGSVRLTSAEQQQANSGDPGPQILWGIGYIQGRYGSPSMAEAHERANNWY